MGEGKITKKQVPKVNIVEREGKGKLYITADFNKTCLSAFTIVIVLEMKSNLIYYA